MLLSMTGFGEAHRRQGGVAATVELRAINNRYFKLSLKCGEGYNALEVEIEHALRERVRRGAVQMTLRVERARSADDFRLNVEVLSGFRRQLQALYDHWRIAEPIPLAQLLLLPGAVDEWGQDRQRAQDDWPLIRDTLHEALLRLNAMREEEGRAMTADLRANLQLIRGELASIEARAPEALAAYRARLTERLKSTLAEFQVTLDAADILKETAIVAERSDIGEEIVRLRSHLDQFEQILDESESQGRKLEFLTQEMLRETNTIGSKSGDLPSARHVIEIKAAIERIREMIQNVE